MKPVKTLVSLTFLIVFIVSCQNSKKSNLTLFSDQIPTDTPLVFGQGIISTDAFEFAITFSPEMDEMYFTRRKKEADNEIFSMQLVDGKWSEPKKVSFSPDIGWDFEPHINPKGDKLYFGSLRPLPDSTKSTGLHQWYLEKTNQSWGEPVPLSSPIKDRFAMFLTSSEDDKLFFTSRETGAKPGEGGIYYANKQNGEYPSITRMSETINATGNWTAHPYIAPDESYIIYDTKSESGFGKSDLYISFNNNGTWTESYNLGAKVNTDQTEMCPSVSPDGKYLFFHRGIYEDEGKVEIGDIYWVDFVQLKKTLLASNPI